MNTSELQVFANFCVAAAESMGYALIRTAHSTFIKETEDFSCTIMSVNGQTFASPRTLGATWYSGLDYEPLIRSVEQYEPGDIYWTNDAYSGSVATHTPDIVMWKPVFHGDRIICFVGGHVHNTDMGGAVPASLSRTLTEVHQEGIRFPPMRIMSRAGGVNEEAVRIMACNVRLPEQNIGDMRAQMASLTVGERKILEIVEKLGVEEFMDGVEKLMDYAEMQAKEIVAAIPDGDYFFDDYADEDSAVDGRPMRVALNLQVRGSELLFDFTGSDPQLNSSLNVPTGGRERHVLPLVGLAYVLYSLNPNMMLNYGMLRVARCILPKGSVVNAVHPAAVGMRSLTCLVMQSVTFGAFSLALPQKMSASPSSGMSVMNVRTSDDAGNTIMASLGPVGGGAGGNAREDGVEGSGANMAFLRNTPVEIIEAEIPIRMREYHLYPGSGGPGKFRGGLALVMEFQVFAPNTMVTARNRDKSFFGAWGVLGGKAGAASFFLLNPGTDREVSLANTDIVHCEPNDVLRITGCAGGGYGNPMERDPQAVLRDCIRGFVSLGQARDDYGVVIRDGKVDEAETRALRAQAPVPDPGRHFLHTPARTEHEKVWTRERYIALTDYLFRCPVTWRYFLKHHLFREMEALPDELRHNGRTEVVRDLIAAANVKYHLNP
ncbi:MAG TPA: hydantoinase B/oxoprolinase family protein [Bordetella sp.]